MNIQMYNYNSMFNYLVNRQQNENNFYREAGSDVQNVPYDYDSVMHYEADAFALFGTDTITPKNGVSRDAIGQRDHLSIGYNTYQYSLLSRY